MRGTGGFRGGRNLYEVKGALAAILAIELDDGLRGGARASKKVKDYRVGAAGDCDEVLDKPHWFGKIEYAFNTECLFSVTTACTGYTESFPVQYGAWARTLLFIVLV